MRESLIAREGLRFIVPSFLLFVVFAWLHYPTLSIICFLFLVFCVFFFRNPKRPVIDEADALLSPADGRVMEIKDVTDREFLGEERKRVAIFMSPLDVHVNRAPCAGRVTAVQHRSGSFAMAFKKEIDQVNERNYILFEREDEKVLIVQIAGFLARRITSWVKPGDETKKGQPVGIISFGSRVDIYLPKGYKPMVDLEERVRAGVTVVARKTQDGPQA